MFKRLFGKFKRGTTRRRRFKVKKQRMFSIKQWFRRFTKIFRKYPKEITPSKTSVKPSITTIFKNKIKRSKLNVKDIELIEGMDAYELRKKYSVNGFRAMLLHEMVDDYKRGKLSLPGISHTSKFDVKSLDKSRLNKMIDQYDEGKRKRHEQHIQEAKNNAKILRKKFNMSRSQASKLQKLIAELDRGQGSNVKLVKNLLNPEKVTKKRIVKFIDRYKEGQKKRRGLSYMKVKSQFSLAPTRNYYT